MLIESEIKNLKAEEFEQGGLIFGMGGGLVQSKLEELYGGQLYCWPDNQKSININEVTGRILLMPSMLTHPAQREIWELLGHRRSLAINLVLTIPNLESISPLLSRNGVGRQISYAIANLQTVIFTRCNQQLANYLSDRFNIESSRFTDISLQSYKVEAPDRVSALSS